MYQRYLELFFISLKNGLYRKKQKNGNLIKKFTHKNNLKSDIFEKIMKI